MFAEYIISCKVAKWQDCFVSFVREDEIAFHPYFAGRQSSD